MRWREEAIRRRGKLEAFADVAKFATEQRGFILPQQLRDEMQRRMDETAADLPVPDSGPETSKAAAEAMTVGVGSLRHKALRCFLEASLTDEEVGERIGHPRIWPRCSELRTMGLIQPTGETRVCRRTAQPCEVCAITEAGLILLASLPEDEQ